MKLTSLYVMNTPGSVFDCTTVTFSGCGGKYAPEALPNEIQKTAALASAENARITAPDS